MPDGMESTQRGMGQQGYRPDYGQGYRPEYGRGCRGAYQQGFRQGWGQGCRECSYRPPRPMPY